MPLHLDTQIRPLRPVLRWVNGGPVDVEALRGKTVLIYFWALSCPSCKEQLPVVFHWERAYKDALEVVGVHTPISVEDMDHATVESAIRELDPDHPVALDGDDGALADAYQVQVTPAYFVFDANGRLRHYHAGVDALGPVAKTLERLLGPHHAETPAPGQEHTHQH